MKKMHIVLALALVLPAVAFAAGGDNVGGCGLGSMVFKGQSGVVPQVLAITTNGTSGNQTFGISSGTLGCSSDGTVHYNAASLFIENNKEKVARDMSTGSGEALASLSHLMGVEAKDQVAFNSLTKVNMARIFSSDKVTTEQIVVALREVLASDAQLSHYQTAI